MTSSRLKNVEINGFKSPLPSKATLLPPARSRGSFRSSLVLQTKADGQDRVFYTHSRGERNCLLLYAAMPNVYDIWEQPNRLSYDSDGKIRHHTPDFLLTLICGKKVAVAYRPEERAKAEYRRELRRFADQMPKGYADKFMLVTDRSFTREQAYNADLFHAFSKSPDPDADSALRDVLRTLIGQVSIENLCKLIGLVGRSFAAVVRAVFQGALKQTCKGYLELSSVVAKGALS